MEKVLDRTVKLKDGTQVVLREMTPEDLDESLEFFASLPEEDRTYLRRDVTDRRVVERRIREMQSGNVKRIVATKDGRIVADGSLELSGESWKAHVGELRLIIAPAFQRKGLGVLMSKELYAMAAAARVDEIVVRMMRPQKGARRIFHKLGFREETILPDYVTDRAGRKQDMILMRCDLKSLWADMESLLIYGDWQRTR